MKLTDVTRFFITNAKPELASDLAKCVENIRETVDTDNIGMDGDNVPTWIIENFIRLRGEGQLYRRMQCEVTTHISLPDNYSEADHDARQLAMEQGL